MADPVYGVNPISVGATPCGIAISPDNVALWIVDTSGGTVAQRDAATNTILKTITLTPGITELAIAPIIYLCGSSIQTIAP